MLMLKRLLRAHKISQKVLAEKLKVDESMISLVANGHKPMPDSMRTSIEALFGADEVQKYDIKPIEKPMSVAATIYPSAFIDEIRDEVREEVAQENGNYTLLDELRRRSDQMDEIIAQQGRLIRIIEEQMKNH